METEFITHEQALALKELGFESPYPIGGYQGGKVFYYENGKLYYDGRPMYSSDSHSGQILAPLYQQAFRWFREKYDLRIWIESNYGVAKFEYVIATTNPNFIDKQFNDLSAYKTYEEAELECLKKLIEIVKEKNQ